MITHLEVEGGQLEIDPQPEELTGVPQPVTRGGGDNLANAAEPGSEVPIHDPPSRRVWFRRRMTTKRLPCGCLPERYTVRRKLSRGCKHPEKRSWPKRLWRWLGSIYEQPSKKPFAKRRI